MNAEKSIPIIIPIVVPEIIKPGYGYKLSRALGAETK